MFRGRSKKEGWQEVFIAGKPAGTFENAKGKDFSVNFPAGKGTIPVVLRIQAGKGKAGLLAPVMLEAH